MSAPKLLNTVYFIFLDLFWAYFQYVHFNFFPNYINMYFKKDKVKGYKGPQTLTCIDKKISLKHSTFYYLWFITVLMHFIKLF